MTLPAILIGIAICGAVITLLTLIMGIDIDINIPGIDLLTLAPAITAFTGISGGLMMIYDDGALLWPLVIGGIVGVIILGVMTGISIVFYRNDHPSIATVFQGLPVTLTHSLHKGEKTMATSDTDNGSISIVVQLDPVDLNKEPDFYSPAGSKLWISRSRDGTDEGTTGWYVTPLQQWHCGGATMIPRKQ